MTEGRDQGTLVFPDAFRKFYLTATDEERARRRMADYQARGHGDGLSLDSVLRDLRERDARDAARAIAPMKPAADAIVVDSTGMAVDAVVGAMAEDSGGRSIDRSHPAAIGRRPRHERTDPGPRRRGDRSDPRRRWTALAASPAGKPGPQARRARHRGRASETGRSVLIIWYRFVQYLVATLAVVTLRWRATGRQNVPESGGVLLVSNHLSYLDVFFLGIPLRRPLNFVARSTLFVPVLAP